MKHFFKLKINLLLLFFFLLSLPSCTEDAVFSEIDAPPINNTSAKASNTHSTSSSGNCLAYNKLRQKFCSGKSIVAFPDIASLRIAIQTSQTKYAIESMFGLIINTLCLVKENTFKSYLLSYNFFKKQKNT